MTTTIQKWGNSQGIRIPKYILEQINYNNGEELEVSIKDGAIVLAKVTKRKNIKELFQNFEGEYQPIDIDWGKPVGEEIW